MERQSFSLVLWTVAAAASIALFVFMQTGIHVSEIPPVEEELETDKIDSTVLPNAVGEDVLSSKSFCISGDDYTLRWDFSDDGTLILSERFLMDGYFSMEVDWLGAYSFDGEKNQLHIKRTALLSGEKKISSSMQISKILTERCAEKILESMESVSVDENISLENLVHYRMTSYVDRLLFEVETFQVGMEDFGLLFEDMTPDLSIYSSDLVFVSSNFDGHVLVNGDTIFIRESGDGGQMFYGGILDMADEKLLFSRLYKFSKNGGKRNVVLEPAGIFKASMDEDSLISDFGTVEVSLRIIDSPKDCGLRDGLVLTAAKELHPKLRWMKGCESESQ